MAESGEDITSSKRARTLCSTSKYFFRRRSTSTPTSTPAAPVLKQGMERQGSGNSTQPISVTLTDAQLLDCPICFEPLSPPVSQCEKGHVACSPCCVKLLFKCPFCSAPIRHIRCLFAERVVESIAVDCENSVHGCKEKLIRANKATHLKNCKYAPCCCPYPDCEFAGFSQSVYEHFSKSHSAGRNFRFGSKFDLVFTKSAESVILQETDKKVVFVITRSSSETSGSLITLICISPSSAVSKRYHSRMLSTVAVHNKILLSGPVDCVQKYTGQLPTTASLVVPNHFIDTSGQLKLQVIIAVPTDPM